jgi:ATP-dependent DNA helicase HFM1/MER3
MRCVSPAVVPPQRLADSLPGSTSSLAVGVNLPAYLVIIRGTQSFDGAWREMNEIDLLQAVGRAGRPQFDTSGCCVILTEQQHKERWQRLLAGSTPIESTLHLDLV